MQLAHSFTKNLCELGGRKFLEFLVRSDRVLQSLQLYTQPSVGPRSGRAVVVRLATTGMGSPEC